MIEEYKDYYLEIGDAKEIVREVIEEVHLRIRNDTEKNNPS